MTEREGRADMEYIAKDKVTYQFRALSDKYNEKMQMIPSKRDYYRGVMHAYSAAADIIDMTDPARVVPECLAKETTTNEADGAHCDVFICQNCGIHLKDWTKIELDEEGAEYHYEYTFKHCPECGAKVVEGGDTE